VIVGVLSAGRTERYGGRGCRAKRRHIW